MGRPLLVVGEGAHILSSAFQLRTFTFPGRSYLPALIDIVGRSITSVRGNQVIGRLCFYVEYH